MADGIDLLIDALSEVEIEQLGRIVLARYARVAATNSPEYWQSSIPAGLRDGLLGATGWDLVEPQVRQVLALNSRTTEALDLLDETPTGELYYPYMSTFIVDTCCWGIQGNATKKFAQRLWQDVKRFAGHVDWQLNASRVHVEDGFSFAGAEEGVWLRHARLAPEMPSETLGLVASSRALSERYEEAIACGLMAEQGCDYILTVNSDEVPAIFQALRQSDCVSFDEAQQGPSTGGFRSTVTGEDLRWQFDSEHAPYLKWTLEASSGHFSDAKYFYVWCNDPTSLVGFLGEFFPQRAFVDPRHPDGRSLEARDYIRFPLATTGKWIRAD